MSSKRSEPYKIKGVNALFEPESLPASDRLLPIAQIILTKQQPRCYFDSEAMANLVESVKQYGILQPILVRPISPKQYEVVAGERRYRAALAAGLTEMPAIIKSLTDKEAQEVALLENLQREDLNPLEETEGILQLLSSKLDRSPENIKVLFHQASHPKTNSADNVIRKSEWQQIIEVLQVVGRFTPESFRTNRLPLLNLPENIKEALRRGEIAYTKARLVARLKDDNMREELLREAIKCNLSVAEIKRRVASIVNTVNTELSTDLDFVPLFKKRVDEIASRLKKSKILDNPKTQKQIEALLDRLENLVSHEKIK
jgi:ParB family chromosome partitioning protein